jgi:preprotein translocase subunit SecB
MSDETKGATPSNNPNEANQPQISVLGQYVKDLSFENPRAPESLREPGTNPNVQINFNVQTKDLAEDTYEVALTFEATATTDEGALYKLELVLAGGFRFKDLPEQALRPVLFIDCPALLFPFARRLVGDLTREGGYPPLYVDPIDFGSLYRHRLAREQAEAQKKS